MSLWQLLRGSGYGGYQPGPQGEHDKVAPLDEVSVAGQANTKRLLASARARNVVFAVVLLGLTLSPLETMPTSTEGREVRFTNARKYGDHFKSLLKWGLLVVESISNICFFNTYFSVPKDASSHRSIFNGKRLSKKSGTPPPVNLLDVPRVLQQVSSLAMEGGLYISTGDIRHWFHQIPVSFELSRWFGLAMDNIMYRWTCLPMGWSYSPAIAQAAAWIFLCHSEDGEEEYFSLKDLENLPSFLEIKGKDGKVIGLITLYYDNYLIVSSDARVVEDLHRRVLRNAKFFNIVLKHHDFYSRKALLTGPFPNFLGVEIGLGRRREGFFLRWRLKKIHELQVPANEAIRVRELASTIGRILYSRLISLAPLGTHSSTRVVLDVLRRASAAAWKGTWASATVVLTNEERAAFAAEVRNANVQQWFCSGPPARRIVFMASDASDKLWGFTEMEDGMVVKVAGPFAYPPDIQENHIFIKELYAAIECIAWAKRERPETDRIHLLIDNTAAAVVLTRRYSSNAKANVLLAGVNVALRVITVPSEVNVADSPSRGKAIEQERVSASWKAFMLDEIGQRGPLALARHDNSGSSPLRHPEEEDEFIRLDEEWALLDEE